MLDRARRLRRDADSCREPRDQSTHTLRVRRRSRIVPRRDRHDRVPRGSTKRVPRCRIAGADRSGERDARGGVGERELVRIAPHGPPDPCPASDAVGALSGQLGVRPSGSPHRDERDAGRAGPGDPRDRAAGPRGRRVPSAHATRDSWRDRVRPREHRGSPVLAHAARSGHRGGHRLARLCGDEPRSPRAGPGNRDATEPRRVPGRRSRGLRGSGGGPCPRGGDPRLGARDRRRACSRLVRSHPRSSEPRDLVASDCRGPPCAPHLRGGRGPRGPRAVSPRRRPRASEGGRPILIGARAFAGLLLCGLRLAVGDDVTVVGSSVPRIAFVRIAGIYRTATPANDELLVDFPMGRFLSGLGPTAFHSIRLRTSNPAVLLSFLRGFGSSVHVSGPDLPRADIASDPPTDERISNLILRSGIGGAPRDYLSTAVAEATSSVAVVAYGIAALLGVLVAFGIHAAQARAFADRARAVGVLRAIGAGNRWMRRRLLLESFPLALGAAVLRAGLGFLAENWLQPKASLVIFGHEVLVAFDLSTFALVVLAVVATSMLSELALLRGVMATRPMETIRETPAVESPQSLEVILRG